jgi:Xaa-Pro aminopeptidase
MSKKGVEAVIIPTTDAHQSEYVPSCWMDREWISGFTGSAGLVIITHNKAALWTDSRYYLQAETELKDCEFKLYKHTKRFQPQHLNWLKDELDSGDKIAVNGLNFTKNQFDQLNKVFETKSIAIVQDDLVSEIWEERPEKSLNQIFNHDIKFVGASRIHKISDVREKIIEQGASHYLVTALDEIAWLTNLRGSDVDFNPIFISYLVITVNESILFIDDQKVPNNLKESLVEDGVIIKAYGGVAEYLNNLPKESKVLIDKSIVNNALYTSISNEIITCESVIHQLKGIKNSVEIANWENAMVRDGVALAHAFYWLENTLIERGVSEVEFGNKIQEFRSKGDNYIGESFPPIVGYNSNGAIIHYNAEEESCDTILNKGVLLCDSGGQYLDGTTDITRTIALSEPTKELKDHYTLVLKGMISLTQAVFPKGTSGGQLDLFARQYLWSKGLDFGHGTGHGVGFFLNVHEGPQGFSPISTTKGKKAIEVGMVTSNEPGFYIVGKYGIRIENLILAKSSNHANFNCFETMTLFPIDQVLIDETAMTSKEKAWLNNYHFEVYEKISPFLEGEEKDWFKRKCKPLN